MTTCPNIKHKSVQCHCQPQDGIMCEYGPQPPFEPWPEEDEMTAPIAAVKRPPLPEAGPIGYASTMDVLTYAKWLNIGPHLPGVRDVALWTTDQMRAYADESIALRAHLGGTK